METHEARIVRLQRLIEKLVQVRQQTIELIAEAANDKATRRSVPNRKGSKNRKRR